MMDAKSKLSAMMASEEHVQPQTLEDALLLVQKERATSMGAQKQVAKLVKRIKLDRLAFAQKMAEQKAIHSTLQEEHSQALETSRLYQSTVDSLHQQSQQAHDSTGAVASENDAMKHAIERGNAELQQLGGALETSRAAEARGCGVIQQLEQAVASLTDDLAGARQQVCERDEAVVQLEASLEELRETSTSYSTSNEEKSSRVFELEARQLDMQNSLDELTAALRAVGGASEESRLQLAALEAGKAQAEALVLERDEDLRKMAALRNTLEDKVQDWKIKHSQSEGERAAATTQAQAERKKTSSILGKFHTLAERYKQLQKKLKEKEEDNSDAAALQVATEEVKQLRQTLDDVSEERRKLRLNIMSQVQDFQKMQKQLSAVVEEGAQLQSSLQARESDLEAARQELVTAGKKHAEVCSLLETEAAAQLEGALEQSRAESQQSLETVQGKLEESRALREANQREIAELNGLLEQSESAAQSAMRDQQGVYRARQEELVAEHEKKVAASAEAYAEALSSQKQKLSQELARVQEAGAEAVSRARRELEEANTAHRLALDDLQSQLESTTGSAEEAASASVQSVKQENTVLRRKLMKLASQYKILKSNENQEKGKASVALDQLTKLLQNTEAELDTHKSKAERLSLEITARTGELDGLRKTHAEESNELKLALDAQSADVVALRDQVKELEMADSSSLALEPDTPTHAEQEELRTRISDLDRQVAQAKAEMGELRARSEAERGAAQEKLTDMAAQLDCREVELSKATTELTDMQLRALKLENEAREREEGASEEQRQGEAALQGEVQTLNEQLKKLSQEQHLAQSMHEEATAAAAVVHKEATAAAAASAAAVVEALEERIETLLEENREMESTRQEAAAAVESAQGSTIATDEHEVQMDGLRSQIQQLSDDAALKKKAYHDLQAMATAQLEQADQASGLWKQIKELQSVVQSLSREKKQLEELSDASTKAQTAMKSALAHEHHAAMAALREECKKKLDSRSATEPRVSAASTQAASKLHLLCNRSMKAFALSLSDIKTLREGVSARDTYIGKQKKQIEGLQGEKKKREKEEAERKEKEKEEAKEKEKEEELKRNSGIWKYVNKLRSKNGPTQAILTDNEQVFDPATGKYVFAGQEDDSKKNDGPVAMPSMLFMGSKAPLAVALPSDTATKGRGLSTVLQGLAAQLKNVDKPVVVVASPGETALTAGSGVVSMPVPSTHMMTPGPAGASEAQGASKDEPQESPNEGEATEGGGEEGTGKTNAARPRRRGWASKAGRTRSSRTREKKSATLAPSTAAASAVISPFGVNASAMPPPRSGGGGNLFSRGNGGIASRYMQSIASIESKPNADATAAVSMLMPTPLMGASPNATASAAASAVSQQSGGDALDGDFDIDSFDLDNLSPFSSSSSSSSASSAQLAQANARVGELTAQLQLLQGQPSMPSSAGQGGSGEWEDKYAALLTQFESVCAQRDRLALQSPRASEEANPPYAQPIASNTSKFWPMAQTPTRSVEFSVRLSKCYVASVVGLATLLGTAAAAHELGIS